MGSESRRFGQRRELAKEAQCPGVESSLQALEKEPAVEAREHAHG
jgi:hypothetical protein